MTRTTSARLAGFMFLAYIATAFPAMVIVSSITGLDGAAAQLAGVRESLTEIRIAVLLYTAAIFDALVLGVALYGITRAEDEELSLLALCCRVAEAIIGAIGLIALLGLAWIASESPVNAVSLTAFLLKAHGWSYTVSALCFALGSTIFAILFYRARSIPVWLSVPGIVASLLIVVLLPAQLVGIAPRESDIAWWPMLLFEVVLGVWLLTKGVRLPSKPDAVPRIIPWA